jgi:hypothetical protein
MTPSELLERLAATFRAEVGPAIEAEYPRTQAFLSAVVLQKLAKQLRLQAEHEELERRESQALLADLERLLTEAAAPAAVREAHAALADAGDAGLCRFIEALYAEREALGEARFDALLERVRLAMRRSLDRRLEYAA